MAVIKQQQYSNRQQDPSPRQQTPSPQTPMTLRDIIVTVLVLTAMIGGVILTLTSLERLFNSFLAGVLIAFTGVRNIPWAVGKINLVEPAMVGAIAGVVIGWIRRGLYVRQQYQETLVSSLVSARFWQGNPGHALLLFVVHGVSGFFVGLIFSSAGVFVPREAVMNGQYPWDKVGLIIEAAGGGGFGDSMSMLLTLLVVAVIVVFFTILIINRALACFIIYSALKGGAGGVAKQLLSVCIEEWPPRIHWDPQRRADIADVMRIALGKSLRQGLVTGVIVGIALTLMR